MQFRVVVPEGCFPGQILRIHLADGTEANATIPTGCGPGDSFVLDTPTHKMQNPSVYTSNSKRGSNGSNSNSNSNSKQHKHSNSNSNSHLPEGLVVDVLDSLTNCSVHSELGMMSSHGEATRSRKKGSFGKSNNNNNNNNNKNSNSKTNSNHKNKNNNNNKSKDSNNPPDPSSSTSSSSSSSFFLVDPFLDQEITDVQDFLMALGIGLLIGTAMVLGFLGGVVHATRDIYALHPIERPKAQVGTGPATANAHANAKATVNAKANAKTNTNTNTMPTHKQSMPRPLGESNNHIHVDPEDRYHIKSPYRHQPEGFGKIERLRAQALLAQEQQAKQQALK